MTHNCRCETAKSPKCHCSCQGSKHGVALEELNKDIGEKYMSYSMGGEVEAFMKNVVGKDLDCKGHICKILDFRGYPHDGGLTDREGKKWWVYVHCDECNQDHSHTHIETRILQQKMNVDDNREKELHEV